MDSWLCWVESLIMQNIPVLYPTAISLCTIRYSQCCWSHGKHARAQPTGLLSILLAPSSVSYLRTKTLRKPSSGLHAFSRLTILPAVSVETLIILTMGPCSVNSSLHSFSPYSISLVGANKPGEYFHSSKSRRARGSKNKSHENINKYRWACG